MRRTFFILILFSIAAMRGNSQTDTRISLGYPVFSQYLQNGLMINPAYTGTRGSLSTFLSYRKQWMNVKGSPDIKTISLHTPMKNDRVGLGLTGQFMSYGYTRAASLYAAYAYNVRVGEGKLSFGIKGGFDRSNTDYTGILLTNEGDPVFSTNQKALFLPNISAGMYYYNDKFFAGFAVPSFLSYNRTSSGGAQASHSFNEYDLMFSAGGLISFSEFFRFKPSVLVNYSMDKAYGLKQLDINGNVILADLIWIGGSWRTTEEVAVGILQIQVNPQLMLGFSYDYPIGRIGYMSKSFMNGSSEFILRYEFGYKISASNPRYF